MQTRFQCESTFTLTSPPWTTGRRLGTHAAASATLGQEICARLRLVRFSSVGHGPTSATERVWNYLPTDLRQPELSYNNFRQSLKTFYVVIGTKAQCKFTPPLNCALEILSLTSRCHPIRKHLYAFHFRFKFPIQS